MPQFDFISNYFLLIIFFIFFISFLLLMYICLNSLYKYICVLKVTEDQAKLVKAQLEYIKEREKILKLWYAWHKK